MKQSKLSTPALKKKAQITFNAYIRARDAGCKCISCGKNEVQQAGHYYSAGKYGLLRFNEDNTNGQCVYCNYHLHGNLLEYRENLIKKIGVERFEKLELLSKIKTPVKNDRFLFQEIIDTYKEKKLKLHFGEPDKEDF